MSEATRRVVVVGIVAMALAAACGGASPSPTPATSPATSATPTQAASSPTAGATSTQAGTNEPLRIGLFAALEGPLAELGLEGYRGAKLALLEWGGRITGPNPTDAVEGAVVAGRPIELVYDQTDGSPDAAAETARRLVESQHVDFVLGSTGGGEGIAVKEYAKTAPDVTFMNGNSGAVETTAIDPAPNFYRFNADGFQSMAGVGTYAYNEMGFRTVATVGEDYSFPYAQVGAFELEFCRAGGDVVENIWMPLASPEMAGFVAQVPAGIDALFIQLSGTNAIDFVRQYDEFTGGALPIIGGSSIAELQVIEEIGARMEGVVVGAPVSANVDRSVWNDLKAAYTENFPDAQAVPSGVAVAHYSNMKALLTAVEQVNGDLGEGQAALRDALDGLALEAPMATVTLDENRSAITTNFVLEVQDVDGNLIPQQVDTVENVDQTLGMGQEQFLDLRPFERDFDCATVRP